MLCVQGARIPPLPVVVAESGAKDSGDNSVNNTDTTNYLPADRAWLELIATYLRTLSERTGRQPSWMFWAFNANSGAAALHVELGVCCVTDSECVVASACVSEGGAKSTSKPTTCAQAHTHVRLSCAVGGLQTTNCLCCSSCVLCMQVTQRAWWAPERHGGKSSGQKCGCWFAHMG